MGKDVVNPVLSDSKKNAKVHLLLQKQGGCDRWRRSAAERSYPTSKEQWLHRRRRAERSYSVFKVRRGHHEERPLVQGKEQWLHFAGAAVKRYCMSKVRETQVSW